VIFEVTGRGGRSAQAELGRTLGGVLKEACDLGKATQAAVACIRRHVQAKYPGSSHWSPGKIYAAKPGMVNIDIPGAGRAWHDVTIVPRLRRKLAIPFPVARGTEPRDWQDSFIVKKKDGSMFLAQSSGSSLVALFALVDRAFQPRDPSLMPSGETMAKAMEQACVETI